MRVTWGWRGFIKRGPTLSRPQVTLTPEPPSVGPQIPPGSQWPSYPDLHRCGLAPASAQGLKPAWARGAKPSDFTRRAQWEAPPLCGCPRPGVAVSSRRGWSAGPGGTPALEPAPQALDPPALETAGSPGFWQRWGVGLCYSGPVAFATSLCPEWTTGSRHREGPFSRSPVPVAILCCPPPGLLERAPPGLGRARGSPASRQLHRGDGGGVPGRPLVGHGVPAPRQPVEAAGTHPSFRPGPAAQARRGASWAPPNPLPWAVSPSRMHLRGLRPPAGPALGRQACTSSRRPDVG